MIWAMTGLSNERSMFNTDQCLKDMAVVLGTHRKSFACVYGVAMVLRDIMIEEFPSLKESRNYANGIHRNEEKRVHRITRNSLVRSFCPSAGVREEILSRMLTDVSAEFCMEW